MDKKEVFCFIPAKSTSKRLKNKNIKILDGQPMMNYSIRAAVESKIFEDNIFVSTDSEKYAAIAQKAGAKITELRSKKLSFDPYGIKDVLLDFLCKNSFTTKFENVLIVSPTCPLLSSKDIINANSLFNKKKENVLISVTETDHNSYRSIEIENDIMSPLFKERIENKSQELNTTYRINGAVIVLNIDSFKKNQSFFKQPVVNYIMPRERSVDVDTIEDFYYAEYLLSKRIK